MRHLILFLFILFTSTTSAATEAQKPQDVLVNVKGMVCDFCAQGLTKLFGTREEVKEIKVDLEAGTVEIAFTEDKTLSDDEIGKIVTDNGLSVESIVRKQPK